MKSQAFGDLAHAAPVLDSRQRGGAGHHQQVRDAGQSVEQFLRDAGGKVLLIGIGREVGEGQYGDRGGVVCAALILPIESEGGFVLATADPDDRQTIASVRRILGGQPTVVLPSGIRLLRHGCVRCSGRAVAEHLARGQQLLMDLEAKGCRPAANAILNRYLARPGGAYCREHLVGGQLQLLRGLEGLSLLQ